MVGDRNVDDRGWGGGLGGVGRLGCLGLVLIEGGFEQGDRVGEAGDFGGAAGEDFGDAVGIEEGVIVEGSAIEGGVAEGFEGGFGLAEDELEDGAEEAMERVIVLELFDAFSE